MYRELREAGHMFGSRFALDGGGGGIRENLVEGVLRST